MKLDFELSIIIPSFNTKKLLRNCLKSIFEQTQKIKFKVIVIDNNSEDGSIKMIKEKFPQVKLICNERNFGFARANNQGLTHAQGDCVLFLNSDTLILDGAIDKAVEFMKKDKRVDILGCQLLNQNKTIQHSGGFFPKLTRVFSWMVFIDELPFLDQIIKPYQQSNRNFYQKIKQLDWVTGGFMLVKKEVINRIKGFDERFFMYAEEVDFCFRAKKLGFNVWFYPGAKIIHFKGKSSKNGFQKAVLGEYQGLKKFYQKHQSVPKLFCLRLLLKMGALLRILIFGILSGDRQKRNIYEKAFRVA